MNPGDVHESSDEFAIRDVAKICDVPAHTIRFWEKEFGEYLAPRRTRGKQRRYDDEVIRKIILIRKLLWTDRYSIRGAKRLLTEQRPTAMQAHDGEYAPDPHQLAFTIAQFIQEQLTSAYPASSGGASRFVA